MKKVIICSLIFLAISCTSSLTEKTNVADSTAVDSLVIDTAIVADSVKVDTLKK